MVQLNYGKLRYGKIEKWHLMIKILKLAYFDFQ